MNSPSHYPERNPYALVIHALSICSGIGGLDLGIHAADPRVRTICYVERQAFAASVLVARMEEKILDTAPIWDDLKTFPSPMFRKKVGVVIGGVPCQPWSTIGPKTGIADDRDLWPHMLRIAIETEAQAIFLENVSGFKSNPNGLARVLRDVGEMGWNAQWGMFSNAALGAPHRRERIFVLAYSDSFANDSARDDQASGGHEFANGGGGGGELANSYSERLQGGSRCKEMPVVVSDDTIGGDVRNLDSTTSGASPGGDKRDGQAARRNEGDDQPSNPGEKLPNPKIMPKRGRGSAEEWNNNAEPSACSQELQYPQSARLESARRSIQSPFNPGTLRSSFWPPGNDPDQWHGVDNRLWPAAPKLPFCGETHGVPDWIQRCNSNRTDRLYCLGNAVSPPVAGVAWAELMRRMLQYYTIV